jgi:hypothetical protein
MHAIHAPAWGLIVIALKVARRFLILIRNQPPGLRVAEHRDMPEMLSIPKIHYQVRPYVLCA